jgi:hypothetical protein
VLRENISLEEDQKTVHQQSPFAFVEEFTQAIQERAYKSYSEAIIRAVKQSHSLVWHVSRDLPID